MQLIKCEYSILMKTNLYSLLLFFSIFFIAKSQTTVTVPLSGNGTWTVPCGVTAITVEAWGGGGGGGMATKAIANGGGGGGAYAKTVISGISAGNQFTYSVGSGGNGGSGNKDGGDTIFSTYVLAKGGKGVPDNTYDGALGGQASESVGDVKYSGGNGGNPGWSGIVYYSGGGGGAGSASGNGGVGTTSGGTSSTPGGTGGDGVSGARSGNNGGDFGGGGSGGYSAVGWISRTGGNGGKGTIKITYTIAAGFQPTISAFNQVASSNGLFIGCTTNQTTLSASGGNNGNGASALWFEGNTCPDLPFVAEFTDFSYILTNATVSSPSNGVRTFTSNHVDPMIGMENVLVGKTFNPTVHKYISIRYRVKTGDAGNVEIYFKKKNSSLSETNKVTKTLISDKNWHIINLDMSTNSNWNTADGGVTGWRYDFATKKDVEVMVDYLVLSSVPLIENTNNDDSNDTQLTYQMPADKNTMTIGVMRTAEYLSDAANCDNTVEKSTCQYITLTRDTKTFSGTGNWDSGSKWTPTGVPTSSHCVFIPNGSSVNVVKDDATAKNITINPGGKLFISNTLTVKDDIKNQTPNNESNFVMYDNGNLIQENDNVTNTRNMSVEREFTFSDDRNQYNFVSSPLIDFNIRNLYPGNPIAIYHSENTNFFYNSSGAYIKGRALALKEPSKTDSPTDLTTGTFIGVPFNGAIDYALAYTDNKPNVAHGYNLLGNPYPSNLDADLLYAANSTLITPTFLFWDNRENTEPKQLGSGYSGLNYAKYNAINNTGVAAGGTSIANPEMRVPNKNISVGTGFMVRALAGTNGQLFKFRNAYRTKDAGKTFFGGKQVNQKDRYWLNLTTPDSLSVMTAVVYFEKGNNAFGLDDSSYSNASDEIYTIADDQSVAIQGRAPFENSDVVPLGLNTFKEGTYSIGLLKKEGAFENGQDIYLKDKETGILTNLSQGQYTFHINKGTTTGRFEIVYKPESTLGVNNATKSKVEVYKDANDFVLRSSETLLAVDLYDMNGRLIFSEKPNQLVTKIASESFANGVYIIKVTQKSGVTVKRVIK